jgi:hypothetical protein
MVNGNKLEQNSTEEPARLSMGQLSDSEDALAEERVIGD